MLGLLAVVLFILLVVSIYHEARSLLNPILLIVFLMVSYLAIIEFLYSHGYGLWRFPASFNFDSSSNIFGWSLFSL